MINYDTSERQFRDQVAARPGGEKVANCYLCGTCTAGCPVSGLRREFNPRQIMRLILLGMKEEVLSSPEIWQCQQCHVCVAHCPQDARFAGVIRVLRQLAVEEGKFPPELPAQVEEMDLKLREQRIAQVGEIIRKRRP